MYTNINQWTQRRLTATLMCCNRAIFCKEYFKVSNRRICLEIGVDQPDQMTKKMTLRSFHKMIWTKSPQQIYNLIQFNNRHRDCSKLGLKYIPSKQGNKPTAIQKALEIFNNIPTGLKVMHPKKLKIELSKIRIGVRVGQM